MPAVPQLSRSGPTVLVSFRDQRGFWSVAPAFRVPCPGVQELPRACMAGQGQQQHCQQPAVSSQVTNCPKALGLGLFITQRSIAVVVRGSHSSVLFCLQGWPGTKHNVGGGQAVSTVSDVLITCFVPGPMKMTTLPWGKCHGSDMAVCPLTGPALDSLAEQEVTVPLRKCCPPPGALSTLQLPRLHIRVSSTGPARGGRTRTPTPRRRSRRGPSNSTAGMLGSKAPSGDAEGWLLLAFP